MIKKEEVKPSNGRVSAGNPSLDPSKRFDIESQITNSAFQEAIHADTENKRANSVAPDGNRDRTNDQISKGRELPPLKLQKKLQKMNPNLHFQRSKAAPSQMGVYLIVRPTEDQPEGLKYLAGFNADVSVKEFDWICVRDRVVRDRQGIPHVKREQCSGCPKCRFVGAERGWRPLLFRLMEAGVITLSQAESFGPPSKDSQNWQRAISKYIPHEA